MFHVSAPDHQRPTHSRLHLRDVRDAQIILEAVRIGVLHIVTRRLNEAERSGYIKSGSVFVWEESDDELGLKRWTDGRFWSQSRMREPFLFYEERVVDRVPNEPRGSRSASTSSGDQIRFVGQPSSSFAAGTGRAGSGSAAPPPSSPAGLVKQTYSAFVHGGVPGSKPRKLHLTAYLTYADVVNLPTVDMDPTLRAIVIPPGVYRSAKARSRQVDIENTYATQESQRAAAIAVLSAAGHASAGAPSASPLSPGPPQPMSPYAGQGPASSSSYSPTSPVGGPPQYPPPPGGLGYMPQQSAARYAYSPSPAPQSSYPLAQSLPPHHQYSSGYGGYPLSPGGGMTVLPERRDEDQRLISMLNRG